MSTIQGTSHRISTRSGASSSQPAARWARRATTVVTTLALTVAVGLAALMLVPAALGYQRYVIVSGSMEPHIRTGSIVYSEEVPVRSLEVGDVITFVPPAEFRITAPVTHRIVSIDDHTGTPVFRTQGDANSDTDPWTLTLDRSQQARVVASVPWVGYAFIALGDPKTRLLALGLPAMAVAVLVLAGLWAASGDAVVAERTRS